MTIFDLACSSGIVEDPAMPSLESTPGNPKTMLFFVRGIVQNKTHWVLADSGSVRNLIDDEVFKLLPFKPPLNQQNIQVFGGNGGPLNIRGFAVLPEVINSTLIWHEFAVVRQFPFEVLIGADIRQPHLCSLRYLRDKQKELKFYLQSCFDCDYN